MKSKCLVPDGHEIRGFMIRLYPNADDVAVLEQIQRDTRYAWNWLVKQTEDTLAANASYALRGSLVGPRPCRPDYDGMEPELAKRAKIEHVVACRAWHGAVYLATKGLPECGFRKLSEWMAHFGDKQDYQMMSRIISWRIRHEGEIIVKISAHVLSSLVKNYFTKSTGQRRKQFRRTRDPMPVQTRSHVCFALGDFGDRRGRSFYDCQIKINGLKIRGRLPGKSPHGRVLEGVSVRREADGWLASIKQVVPMRQRPEAIVDSVVGIDVGLDQIAAISEVTAVGKVVEKSRLVSNARGKIYAERIAGRQAMKLPVGRLQCAAARHVRHTIYNEIVKPLANVETIKVERLPAHIGHMGSSKASVMRLAIALLIERYGDRVREVEPHYTSQDCSQCGERSKESWSYTHGRIGECLACGHRQDRDLNAARNIAAKSAIPLVV